MDEKKMKLIEALKKERSTFSQRGQCTLEHDIAIHYLETGHTDKDPDEFGLLEAVMNDYEMTCLDYLF